MPGATAWLDASPPNSSIEQWRMVVIVTGYTLYVTSQYDVILTFANQRFGEVCCHNLHIQGPRSSGRAGGTAAGQGVQRQGRGCSKTVEDNGSL